MNGSKKGVLIVIAVLVTFAPFAIESKEHNHNVRLLCEIQEKLAQLGFDPGPVNGEIGEKMRMAVGQFLLNTNQQDRQFSVEEVVSLVRTYFQNEPDTRGNSSNIKASARPQNGLVLYSNGELGVAPLEIRTANQGYDYYIKISDPKDNRRVKTVYLRSGKTVKFQVPLGTFEMKYVTGETWFGSNCLFGSKTSYNKADNEFKFEYTGSQYTGYSIELIKQKDGNLATQELRPEQW